MYSFDARVPFEVLYLVSTVYTTHRTHLLAIHTSSQYTRHTVHTSSQHTPHICAVNIVLFIAGWWSLRNCSMCLYLYIILQTMCILTSAATDILVIWISVSECCIQICFLCAADIVILHTCRTECCLKCTKSFDCVLSNTHGF